MRTWYFYSTPDSTIPSPYFKRVPPMLAALSKKGILRFRLWQGSHEAPVPLEDGPEPLNIDRATELPNEQERWAKDRLIEFAAIDDRFFRTHILGDFPGGVPRNRGGS
jgi:hypothetical protein